MTVVSLDNEIVFSTKKLTTDSPRSVITHPVKEAFLQSGMICLQENLTYDDGDWGGGALKGMEQEMTP